MITMAQRLEELRTQRGLSRPALAAALGLPRMSVEKFETGRQTPSQEQQAKMASYFGVSLSYLRGETNDPKDMDDWMDGAFLAEPAPAPVTPGTPAQEAHGCRCGAGQHVRCVFEQQEIPGESAGRGFGCTALPGWKGTAGKGGTPPDGRRKVTGGFLQNEEHEKRPGDLLSGPSLIAERFECGSGSFERGPDMLLAPPASACPGGQPRIPGGPVPGPPAPARRRG